MNFRKIYQILAGLIIALATASCLPQAAQVFYAPWNYADLRLYDPVDASLPSHDLIAVYTRQLAGEAQIRLDLLDHAPLPDYDLYLIFDAALGGTRTLPIAASTDLAWESLVFVPSEGPLQVLDSQMRPLPGSALRVLRDPLYDTIDISLKHSAVEGTPVDFWPPGGYTLQVFLTPAGSLDIADSSGPIHSDSASPPPVQILFAFWNSYPAYTPAAALRRWNGAHTGPFGGRHGLYHLLRTARGTETPLVLLDLKSPTSLSALDYAGYLDLVSEMTADGGLVLPEPLPDNTYGPLPLPDWALANVLEINHQTARSFDLPGSPFLFSPQPPFPSGSDASLVFTFLPRSDDVNIQPTAPQRWRELTVLPIPKNLSADQQASLDGPTLELRRALIDTALQASTGISETETPILVLGGELPASAWGVPEMARATFRYLRAHPWLQIVGTNDLLSLSSSEPFNPPPEPVGDYTRTPDTRIPEFGSTPKDAQDLDSALRNAPSNTLSLAAWQAYLALYAPIYPAPPDLPALRANYLGGVWSLLAAADWAAEPYTLSSCDMDPDHDGRSECILAAENMFVLLEPGNGGYISHAFARTPSGMHQIIGPSSQFITGLSDPSSWGLDQGVFSDPSVIPGAFVDAGGTFTAHFESDRLIFTSPEQDARKTFQLTPNGLQVEIEVPSPNNPFQLSLVLDPWERFSPDWVNRYQAEPAPMGWSWSLEDEVTVQIQASEEISGSPEISGSTEISVATFLDPRDLLGSSENPNLDYPPGHFLPFPMALLSFSINSEQDVQNGNGVPLVIQINVVQP